MALLGSFGGYAASSLEYHLVQPKDTDDGITVAAQRVHIAYRDPASTSRKQLFVMLPGSGSAPVVHTNLGKHAAALGFHSIGLMYPNEATIASLCGRDGDPTAYARARAAVCFGLPMHPQVPVRAGDCITNRLAKLVHYLHRKYPAEGWGKFLDAAGGIDYSKVVLAGFSQGGGHAAFLAKYLPCLRWIGFAAPADWRLATDLPPPWFSQGDWATPASRGFMFCHADDDVALWRRQEPIAKALGLPGAAQIAEDQSAPYGESHLLVSRTAVRGAHPAVAADDCLPFRGGEPLYLPVWTYLLTWGLPDGER
ncbi:MAG: hypothetical protein J0L75_06515 [Spirochaetes bacterium]|nr:hypothetical protein [Spirochaetota bacterium]